MEGSASMLGQQQLLEPAPVRRMIVPRGHAGLWGGDPGCARLAVAYIAPDGARGALTTSFAPGKGGQRLSGIYAQTRSFALGLLEDGWPIPGLVWWELPAGDPPNVELLYAAGVQQAAVYDACAQFTGQPVAVESVSTAKWKKVACGKGNLYKPSRKKLGRTPVYEDYAVAVWARLNGYTGSSYDEADAWGIVEAARREVALEER